MARNNRKTPYTDGHGKFAIGNPGRPRGARHRTSLAIEALLDGDAEGLTRKAVDMALQGDTTALRLCLERVCPPRKDAPVQFDLPPMESAGDAAQAAGAIVVAVAQGDLTPLEGASLMGLIENYRRTLELTEIERRMANLEKVFDAKP